MGIKSLTAAVLAFALLISFSSFSAPSAASSVQEDTATAFRSAFPAHRELSLGDPSRNEKWREMLVRHARHQPAWAELAAPVSEKSAVDQVIFAHRFFNRYRRDKDLRLWQRDDYWASPAEFMAMGAGDCEDFAIAKYFLLRALGFPEESLRLMVATLADGTAHMVLLVSLMGKVLVLDNLEPNPIVIRADDTYQPLYAMTEHSFAVYVPTSEERDTGALAAVMRSTAPSKE